MCTCWRQAAAALNDRDKEEAIAFFRKFVRTAVEDGAELGDVCWTEDWQVGPL
jgi:hypothetical protein